MDAVEKAQLRPPRDADGDGAGRLPALHALLMATTRATPAGPTATASCSPPGTARCCSTRVLHLCRLRPAAGGAAGASASGDRTTPGHPERILGGHETPGRRDHHRAARPGVRERRRDGDGRALPARALRRGGHGPPRLRDLLGRRPDGGGRLRGRLARRAPRPRPARLPLRRQPHHDRRLDRRSPSRGRRGALPRLRLARAGSVEDANDLVALARGARAPRRRGGAPVADPGALHDRLAGAEQAPARPRPTARRSASDEVRATKRALGWDPDREFHVPDEVYEAFASPSRAAGELQREWRAAPGARWRAEDPAAGRRVGARLAGPAGGGPRRGAARRSTRPRPTRSPPARPAAR